MSKKEYLEYKKSYMLVPLSISFLLIIGVIVSLVQVRQQQTTESRAANETSTASSLNCSVPPNELVVLPEEQSLFDQINVYRKQQGVAPLIWTPLLKKTTTWMSKDMLAHGSLSHIDSLGRNLETRLAQCEYPFPAIVEEIIDSGTSDPNSLLTAWRHASKHNANLLNPAFTNVGITLGRSADGSKIYWTAEFAGPAPTPTPAPTKISSPPPLVTNAPTTKPIGSPTDKPVIQPTNKPNPTPTKQPFVTRAPTNQALPTKSLTPTVTLVPTIDPKFVKNPLDTQILVVVKYIGIGKGGNKNPKNLSRKVQADIYDLENNVIKTGQGYIQYDNKDSFSGIVHLGKIPDGKYYVKIISDFNLTSIVLPEFQELSNQRLNILPQVLLTQGDLDSDNLISVMDYSAALLCFQDKKCPAAELIDFNDDGKTDVTDYNILLRNYLINLGD